MDSQKNNGMCRCCASEGTFKDVKTAYQWMGEEEVYADMLRECLDISLCADVTGDVEGGICEVCITQLRNASNFKKQVLHTEDQFKRRLQEGLFKSDIVKVEVPTVDEDSDNDNNLSEDFSGTEFEVPVKTESVEEPKAKKRTAKAKASTSRVKKMKAEDGETSKRKRRRDVAEKTSKTKVNFEEVIVKDEMNDEAGTNNEIKKTNVNANLELQSWRVAVRGVLASSNATTIRNHGDKGYGCCFCTEQFPDPADLKRHNTDLHIADIKKFKGVKEQSKFFVKMDITDLRCNLCEQNFTNIEQLIGHLNDIHNKKIFADIKRLILPFKFEKIESKELRCCECWQSFHTFKILQEHMHSHYSNFICDVCSAGFVTRNSLLLHRASHETGSFKCSYCPKVFDSQPKAKMHESKLHENAAPKCVCKFCNERFKDFRKKQKHLEQVHGVASTSYKCHACDKSFAYKNTLQYHTKRYHLMLRPHRCKECGMEFFTAFELSQHMVKHTPQDQFRCDICPKTFCRKQSLKGHKRIHTDDMRFKCEHCGHLFVTKCNLKRHMRKKHMDLL